MMKSIPRLSKPFLSSTIQLVMFALLLVFGATAALAQTRGYVTNGQDNTVSVIDTATRAVIATVPVGSSPSAVAVTPNGRFAYVANTLGSSVSVISAVTNTVVATVPVGSFPRAIAITPNGAFVYVTCSSPSNISVINTATNTVVATIPLTRPSGIAMAPNGALAYVTHGAFDPSVTVIDTATNTVVANIPVPVNVTDAPAVTPNGAFVYVTCLSFSAGSKLAVIDTATNTLAAIVPLPPTFAPGVAIAPNGALAYVANNGGGVCCVAPLPSSVSVIDTASNTEIANVPVGSPLAIAVTPDGAFVYITNLSNNTVSVLSTATNTLFDVVAVGTFPQSIAFGTLTEDPPEVDPIEALLGKVQTLIADGVLTQEQGAGLLDKIHEAIAKLDAGQTDAGQTSAACNQLSSLINQVNGFISSGTLTPAQGEELINAVNAVKTDIGC
jgi:YVTN family beta-propeller protein